MGNDTSKRGELKVTEKTKKLCHLENFLQVPMLFTYYFDQFLIDLGPNTRPFNWCTYFSFLYYTVH